MRINALRFVFVALVALVLSSACGHTPTGPDPVIPPGPQPKPTPGTNMVTVPLPGSATPMSLWAERIIPAEGNSLEAGKSAELALSCTGPGGYRYHIRAAWVVEGQPEPTRWDSNLPGFGSVTGPKCDWPLQGWTYKYQPVPGAMRVKALRLFVWRYSGTTINKEYLNNSPDVVGDLQTPESWNPIRLQ